MSIWVTRPEPDATATAAVLRAAGHSAWVHPLIQTRLEPVPAGVFTGVAGLIVTSRNAVRALAASSVDASVRSLPCFAVGAATGELLRDIGFTRVVVGGGTAAGLAPTVMEEMQPGPGPLLYISGEVVAGELMATLTAKGYVIRQQVVYSMVPAPDVARIDTKLVAEARLDTVLLMSAETARVYARVIQGLGLEGAAAAWLHLCLSRGVARALAEAMPGSRSLRCVVAPTPDLNGILQILAV